MTFDQNIYERQQDLPIDPPNSIAIVGCGGVGSWVALFAALAGTQVIWLYDDDTVDTNNLNRTPYTPSDVANHVPKVHALKEIIQLHRPEAVVYAVNAKFSPELAKHMDTDSSTPSWIIVATDTVKSRQEIKQWADEHSRTYLEVAAEGEVGSVTGQPADWSTPAEAQVGYRHVPVWLGPAVASAVMAVTYMMHGLSPNDTTMRFGWNAAGPDTGLGLYDSSKSETADEPENDSEAEQEIPF